MIVSHAADSDALTDFNVIRCTCFDAPAELCPSLSLYIYGQFPAKGKPTQKTIKIQNIAKQFIVFLKIDRRHKKHPKSYQF